MRSQSRMELESLKVGLAALEETGFFSKSRQEQQEKQREKDRAETLFATGAAWPMTKLLPELIASIFSFFDAKKDKRDLANLCLVSRVFLLHVRPLLYSTLKLAFLDDLDHLQTYHLLTPSEKLYSTLCTCPELNRLVTSFTLRISTTEPDLLAEQFGLDLHGASIEEYKLPEDWVDSHTVDLPAIVLEVLEQLPSLGAFIVETDCPYKVDTSFLASANFSQLQTLHCYRVHPEILVHASKLKSLVCSTFTFGDDGDLAEAAEEWGLPPSLESLVYVVSDDPARSYQVIVFFAWLCRSSFTTLKHLSVSYHPFVHFSLDKFINLRTLDLTLITLPDEPRWVAPSFGEILASLPSSLVSLKIHTCQTAEEPSPTLEKTYLANLPRQLEDLCLEANLFHPAAILALLERVHQRLPRLRSFALRGQPQELLGLRFDDSKSHWQDEHWQKVVKQCEDKKIACHI
ncbi:hypothetical protein JCM11251_000990 [Rhodosporidiobolus azoricus]